MSKPPLFSLSFVLAALATLMLSLAGFLFVHLPGFLQTLGAGEAQIGRIMSVQAVGAILAWPVIARAMDGGGRRKVILGGCGLFVLVVALYLLIDTIGPFIYLVRILDGAVHAMWYVALFTYGADLVPPERRTEGLAIFGVSALVPIGLGALVGDAILLYASYRGLFLGALGFAVAGFLLCLPLRDSAAAQEDVEAQEGGLFSAVIARTLIPVWVVAFTFFIALFGLFNFMKTYVTATGVGTVGGFFGTYAGIAVVLRLFMGWLPDRLGPRRMLGLALVCYALGFMVLAAAQTPLHVFIAGLLCGAGHGYTYPVLLSLVVSRADEARRGSAIACYTAIDWLGLLLAGPVVGMLIEATDYAMSFSVLALALLAGVGSFYLLDTVWASKVRAAASVGPPSR